MPENTLGAAPTCVLPADLLPTEWTLGGATGPSVYTGMNLTHFICRECRWSAASDPGLAMQRSLEWIDISLNPLAAPYDTLPLDWHVLPLVALKVGQKPSRVPTVWFRKCLQLLVCFSLSCATAYRAVMQPRC